jgi:hypothetical protein
MPLREGDRWQSRQPGDDVERQTRARQESAGDDGLAGVIVQPAAQLTESIIIQVLRHPGPAKGGVSAGTADRPQPHITQKIPIVQASTPATGLTSPR